MTPKDAANWMKSELEQHGLLYQSAVANELGALNDERLAYYDDEGSLCIGKVVLTEFRNITPDVIYIRADKMWRPREDYDRPGRLQ